MEQTNLRNRFLTIAVVTGLLVWAFLAWGVRLGQDLRGGTTLRFSLDLDRAEQEGRIESGADRDKIVADTIKIIRERIDKFGLSEIELTPLGETKFEISLPAGSEGEVESIEQVVTSLGDLKFRIEVLPTGTYRALARRQQDAPAPGAAGHLPVEGNGRGVRHLQGGRRSDASRRPATRRRPTSRAVPSTSSSRGRAPRRPRSGTSP